MTDTEILERVVARLPLPQQITHIEFPSPTEVRFTWRSARYRVSEHLNVEEVSNGLLSGTDAAILMSALLKTNPR